MKNPGPDRLQNQRGASLVELTIILPLIVLISAGATYFGQVLVELNATTPLAYSGAFYFAQKEPFAATGQSYAVTIPASTAQTETDQFIRLLKIRDQERAERGKYASDFSLLLTYPELSGGNDNRYVTARLDFNNRSINFIKEYFGIGSRLSISGGAQIFEPPPQNYVADSDFADP